MSDVNFKKTVETNFYELLEENFQEMLTIVSRSYCSTFQGINRQSFSPANIYLFKLVIQALGKDVKYDQC